jgi:SAM domain (Sterile alpha motif)
MMETGGWLRSLGLEQYEAAFHANAVDTVVLRDLTDQDLQKLGVLPGHRHKLLRAIATLNGAFAPKRPSRRPASLAPPERQEGKDYSVPPSPPPSPISGRRRPAEMISDRFLPTPVRTTTSRLTAFDDRDRDDNQAADWHGSRR